MKFIQTFVLTILASALFAQITPNTQGIYVNLDLAAGAVAYNDDDTEDNGGYGGINLAVGYGFTPTFTLYAQFSGGQVGGESNTIFQEDYSVGSFELMARFHFGRKIKSPVFYLEGGLQGFSARPFTDPDVDLSGAGLTVAPGILLYVNPKLAIDLNLAISGGSINSIKSGDLSLDLSDEDLNYGITRFSVGVSWFPSNK